MLRFAFSLLMLLGLFVSNADAYFTYGNFWCRKNFTDNKWSASAVVKYIGGWPENSPNSTILIRVALTVKDDSTGIRYTIGTSGSSALSDSGGSVDMMVINAVESDTFLDDDFPELQVQAWDGSSWVDVTGEKVIYDDTADTYPGDYDFEVHNTNESFIDLNTMGVDSYLYLALNMEAVSDGGLSKLIFVYMEPVQSDGYQSGTEVYCGSISVDSTSHSQRKKMLILPSSSGVNDYGYMAGGQLKLRCAYKVLINSVWTEVVDHDVWVNAD